MRKAFVHQGHEKGSSTWTGKIRSSLVPIDESDGQLIESLLYKQAADGSSYEFDPEAYARLAIHTIRRADKSVPVSVPTDTEETSELSGEVEQEVRESIRIQALIANIGSQMGHGI